MEMRLFGYLEGLLVRLGSFPDDLEVIVEIVVHLVSKNSGKVIMETLKSFPLRNWKQWGPQGRKAKPIVEMDFDTCPPEAQNEFKFGIRPNGRWVSFPSYWGTGTPLIIHEVKNLEENQEKTKANHLTLTVVVQGSNKTYQTTEIYLAAKDGKTFDDLLKELNLLREYCAANIGEKAKGQ